MQLLPKRRPADFLFLFLFFLGLLRACELLDDEHLVQLLKAIKHLSMNVTLLDALQNANAIDILVRILLEHGSGPHSIVRDVLVNSASLA